MIHHHKIFDNFCLFYHSHVVYTGPKIHIRFKNIRFDITNAEYVASPFADGIVQRIVTVEKENPNVLSHISMHQKSEDELEIINKVADPFKFYRLPLCKALIIILI